MATEINLSSLPKKQKLIYLLTLENKLYKDIKIDDEKIKMFTYKHHYNVYRYDKFLDNKINPNHFFYYFKDSYYRGRLNNSKINIIEKINDKEWIEEWFIYGKNIKIKIICDNYQIVAYVLDNDIPTFEIFSLKIRESENKYLIRLEMVFNTIDLEQEYKLKNEIILINKFENVILQNLHSN